ncbi:ABC transporter permease [Brachybacterium halotolerans subsp. kimchii]|uniref:ABC transporter permease n=1 Tax=Brachybacterium halotolerans TaxID=2795215 RepID=UPI001E3F0E54|nr:ABC transporter permease [Brachybacterium halotolerans]UEJ81978.1 ABC transporter permease [Brachybacterium halotolerans subsp. kimchii]
MTTAPALTTTATAASPSVGRGAPASQTRRTVRFALSSTSTTLRKGMFLFFTVALPILMFLMFNEIFGKEAIGQGGDTVGTFIMVRMAAYGGLGAAINAGAIIQLERTNGWLRQLMVAGLTPRSFVIGKMVAAMVIVLPALIGVYLAGALVAGIHLDALEAVRSLLALWIGMLPLVLLGLVVGLALKPSAVGAATTIGMMLLAVAGGLWFPYEMFPSWLQTISRFTPTYWVGELGTWGIIGEDFPMRGAVTLAAWTLGLAVIAALLLGRAARSASRR